MADLITSMKTAGMTPAAAPVETAPVSKTEEIPAATLETKADTVELSNAGASEKSAPKISRWRLLFSRLTKEQIKQVNETRQLPDNAKFEFGLGHSYSVANNWFNMTAGTQIIPAGYELKQDILGFTHVLPIGTKGLLIRNDK